MNTLLELENHFGTNRIRQNEPMNTHISFKSGGGAEYYLDVETIDDLVLAVKTARQIGLGVTVIGAGTNMLVADTGIKGLVIKNNARRIELLGMKGKIRNRELNLDNVQVFAESGAITNQLVRFSIDQGLAGLETSLGLPGTVGGAVVMNANYPKEDIFFGSFVTSAKILTSEGEVKEVSHSFLQFGFDTSCLKRSSDILLSVVFTLTPMDRKILWSKAMEAAAYRDNTQPKVMRDGCTFRNIKVIQTIGDPLHEKAPSADFLFEHSGLQKKRVGDAVLSDINPRYILNLGKATTADAVSLISEIKDEMNTRYGVELTMNAHLLGEK